MTDVKRAFGGVHGPIIASVLIVWVYLEASKWVVRRWLGR